jgi:hypothetical protein
VGGWLVDCSRSRLLRSSRSIRCRPRRRRRSCWDDVWPILWLNVICLLVLLDEYCSWNSWHWEHDLEGGENMNWIGRIFVGVWCCVLGGVPSCDSSIYVMEPIWLGDECDCRYAGTSYPDGAWCSAVAMLEERRGDARSHIRQEVTETSTRGSNKKRLYCFSVQMSRYPFPYSDLEPIWNQFGTDLDRPPLNLLCNCNYFWSKSFQIVFFSKYWRYIGESLTKNVCNHPFHHSRSNKFNIFAMSSAAQTNAEVQPQQPAARVLRKGKWIYIFRYLEWK